MITKNTVCMYALVLLMVCSGYSAAEKNLKIDLQNYVSESVNQTFKDFCAQLPEKIDALSKNAKGCLINLLDAQSYLFSLMEQELTKGSATSQETIEKMMQSFQKALETFEKQCDQATKELYEEIQKAIASLVPQELAMQIQTLQEEMQKKYNTAKDKNQLSNETFQKEITILQNNLMQKLLYIQAITSLASIEIYKVVYQNIEKKHKDLLVRRFDVNGIIPLTKRKNNVTHPDKALSLIQSFLEQANTLATENQNN